MAEQEPGTPNRGELMRQIAALHSKMAMAYRKGGSSALTNIERQEILRQIVALEKRLMEM